MIWIFLLLLLITTLYLYATKNFDYWKIRGIKHDRPLPLVGTCANMFFFKRSWTQHLLDMYRKYPGEKLVGSFRSSTPELIIREPDIVKRILVTDFSHFYMRAIFPEDASEPLLRHLFNADGDLWRLLRQRLTPAFTTGKLKAMFLLIVERAERLITRILATSGTPIDARDLMARFTTDFIGACVFGLDMDSLTDEDSEFRKLGKNIANISTRDSIIFYLKQSLPFTIFKNFKFTARFEEDLQLMVSTISKQRNYEPSGRNDFVDLLLQCKQKGTIVGESMERFKPDGTPEISTLEMTEDLMAAQMFVFFAAGFETSSSTTSYTLHLLAYHPDKQKKVQEDIRRALSKYDNKLCYDAIKEMHYLEWAFKESMRIFPSVGFLVRECAHSYQVPELNLTIEKGIKVYIPVEALQNDSKYFDNPEDFRPERFSPQELDVENTKFAYLPFGDGPRACIAERLGLMQSMAGLAAVLSTFTVEPAPNSLRHPIVVTRPSIVQTIQGGLPLLFRKTCLE